MRLDDLVGSEILFVWGKEAKVKVIWRPDSCQILSPEPDAINIPAPRYGYGGLGKRGLCLTEREWLRRLIGEETLPLRKGGARITRISALSEDGR